jgi:hypothetical protein
VSLGRRLGRSAFSGLKEVIGIRCSKVVSGCMPDGGEQPGSVVVVETGDGVAEVDGDAACEAGRQQQDAALAVLSRGGLRGLGPRPQRPS